MHSRLTELIDILDLEQIEENVFRGRHQVENRNRLYDHALWFHDPGARVDRWIRYALDAPLSSATRGYNRGSMFGESGHLIASTMQESLMRLR